MNIYEHYFKSLRGAPLAMSKFQGQPIMIVNTASECGYTPQYQQLQRLWMEYRGGGLVVVGIPSNDFGEQEPGDDEAIDEFCHSNYGVTFPMTAKQTFRGPDAHPMFVAMVEEFTEDVLPRWNFYKYLFGKDGDLIEFWPSDVLPDDSEFRRTIEQNLASWRL